MMHVHPERAAQCKHVYGYDDGDLAGQDAIHACPHCDVAYCAKCGKEWGTHTHYLSSQPVYVIPYWETAFPRLMPLPGWSDGTQVLIAP